MSSNMPSKNPAITLLRVFSMILILLTHVIRYYSFIPGNTILNQVFTVGTSIFFLISGFLYGKKNISDFGTWYFNRWKRIALPILLLALIVWGILAPTTDRVSFSQVVPYLLCMQGLPFLEYRLFSPFIIEIPALGPLWFATIIMFCYALTPLYQFLTQKLLRQNHGNLLAAILFLALFALSILLRVLTEIRLTYFLIFFLGYLLGAFSFGELHIYHSWIWVGTLCALLAQVGRLVFRHFADGTSGYSVYTSFSQLVLALWIFALFFYLYQQLPSVVEKLASSVCMVLIDKLSFYVYLTHGLFCMGNVLNMYMLVGNIWVSTLLFLLCTSIASVLLYLLHQGVLWLIEPHKRASSM